jgi:hypothetical protein
MEDKKFIIAYDGYSDGDSFGGHNSGYPTRKILNVDTIGKYWYLLRDHPSWRSNVKFYELKEIPLEKAFAEMEEARTKHEKEEKQQRKEELRRKLAEMEDDDG